MATKRTSSSRRAAPKSVRVRIEGKDHRATLAEVRVGGRRVRPSAELVRRATSPWWFWVLERPLADAIAQALIDSGAVSGVASGHDLVEDLRRRYY